MAEFFVENTENTPKTGHQIHKKDCRLIVATQPLHYLGSFSHVDAAIEKAKGRYHAISLCPKCLPEKTPTA